MSQKSNKPAYVSSSSTVGLQSLTSRISGKASNVATLVYLFFETLISPTDKGKQQPMVNPALWVNPSGRVPDSARRPGSGLGGNNSGGTGGGGSGGGGRFMTMGDLRGGQTVDGCRATCG
nr:hypothetical protein L204_05685 [Cryptococcus depauperatus CBS 7855]